MLNESPFNPIGATLAISATSSGSTNGTLPASGTPVGNQIRVVNSTTAVAFIAWASSSAGATATTSSLPVLPGVTELFTIDPAANSFAAILSAGSGNVYITRGEGN